MDLPRWWPLERWRCAVNRLNDLGGVLDCSHCGLAITHDAINTSSAPVDRTHIACGALVDHPCAKSDEVLETVVAENGNVGIDGVPWFLTPDANEPDMAVFFDQLEQAIDVIGPRRIGIDSDFGTVDAGFLEGYGSGWGDVQRFVDRGTYGPRLESGTTRTLHAGFSGENFLAFGECVIEW